MPYSYGVHAHEQERHDVRDRYIVVAEIVMAEIVMVYIVMSYAVSLWRTCTRAYIMQPKKVMAEMVMD